MMKFCLKHTLSVLALVGTLMISTASFGAIEIYEFKSAEDEARYKALIEELRCPKCQNQNLAGSDAPIAVDLKNQTYQMIQDGRSDAEIRQFMFDSYGDFISYKPPVRPSTWILWFFPPILLVVFILGWVYKAKKGRTVAVDEVNALSKAEEERVAQILAKHQSPKSEQAQHSNAQNSQNSHTQTDKDAP
ncbi:Cytochrome c-type biogenesis protein CcmH precursor [Moraxella lacunata]|uniref:Cytochrome c-type biogenesis protein n=1 Tax=Moraxella lacunata TaxID=477 RepID=A0A378T9F0_MORLA|nr:cytochrome c-type biogenesis protein [Moraxella lacunata]STZ56166.1 Cytochrome c-type biogenesis protein CcmH precursor [Moraxella lacunata]